IRWKMPILAWNFHNHAWKALQKAKLRYRKLERAAEWFRPFAPSILAEYQDEYFAHGHSSPYMLHVYKSGLKSGSNCAVNQVYDTRRLLRLSSVGPDRNSSDRNSSCVKYQFQRE